MKNYKLIIIAFLAFATAACTAATQPAKPNNNAGNTNAPEPVNKPVETPKPSAGAPGDTIILFFEAVKRKDVEGIKKYISKASLKKFEEAAKAQNKTIENIILDGGDDPSQKNAPETRNEKINGDSATLEVKDEENGKWEPVPLVKEDGIWKIAFDKLEQ